LVSVSNLTEIRKFKRRLIKRLLNFLISVKLETDTKHSI